MNTYAEIMAEIVKRNEELAVLTKEAETIKAERAGFIDRYVAEGTNRFKATRQAKMDTEFNELLERAAEIERKIRHVTLVIKVLKSNATHVMFAETMPVALEVINKYVGKRIGEKTENKISAEIFERTGIKWYYTADYSVRWNFYGNSESISAYLAPDTKMFNADGKLNEITAEMIVDPTSPYVENPVQYVWDMERRAEEIKAAAEKLNDLIDSYNNNVVDGFERYDRLYKYNR